MDVKYINPFIRAVNNTMETMLGKAPVRNAPKIKEHMIAQGDISGIIGFAGEFVQGSVALSFSTEAALKIYRTMMGEIFHKINHEVEDTVGELINIVAGGAKTEFENNGLSFRISIPTVVVGRQHTIAHRGTIPIVLIPFTWDGSSFVMEVSMKVEHRRNLTEKAMEAAAP